MYQENDFSVCIVCGAKGIVAPNISGMETFFHKISSPRISGYYTFTDVHQLVTANVGG